MVMYSQEMKLQHFENGPFLYHLLLKSAAKSYRQKWAGLSGGPGVRPGFWQWANFCTISKTINVNSTLLSEIVEYILISDVGKIYLVAFSVSLLASDNALSLIDSFVCYLLDFKQTEIRC